MLVQTAVVTREKKSECCFEWDMFGVHATAPIESLARALCPCADCGPILLLRAARRRKSVPDLRHRSSRWSFRRKSGGVDSEERDSEFDFDFDAGGFEDWAEQTTTARKVGLPLNDCLVAGAAT